MQVWGDSEVGIVSSDEWAAAYQNWNIQFPAWIPALAPQFTRPWSPTVNGYILAAGANYYTQSVWAAYTSNGDAVQVIQARLHFDSICHANLCCLDRLTTTGWVAAK